MSTWISCKKNWQLVIGANLFSVADLIFFFCKALENVLSSEFLILMSVCIYDYYVQKILTTGQKKKKETHSVFYRVYILSYLRFYFIYLYLNILVVNIPYFVTCI